MLRAPDHVAAVRRQRSYPEYVESAIFVYVSGLLIRFTALLSLALSGHCEAHSTAAALSPAAADAVRLENKRLLWTLDPLQNVLRLSESINCAHHVTDVMVTSSVQHQNQQQNSQKLRNESLPSASSNWDRLHVSRVRRWKTAGSEFRSVFPCRTTRRCLSLCVRKPFGFIPRAPVLQERSLRPPSPV